jgi:hypothetical protein
VIDPAPSAEPLETDTVAPREAPLPGALEIVGRGLDLDLAASATIRRASFHAALMYLLLLGPVALIIALLIARYGIDFFADVVSGTIPPFMLDLGAAPGAILIGGFAAAAVSVDIQNIAVSVLHQQAVTGRSSFRAALGVARRSFWRLIFASIASGIVVRIAATILQRIVGFDGTADSNSELAIQTAIELVVTMPFAYIGAAVVIGRTGPIEAIRVSVGLARRRWRLAFVIGLVNTATSLLAAFGASSGADILGRIAIGLGIGSEGVGGVLPVLQLALIVAFAIAALGSLTMTIAALTVASQVVAYLRLGGPERREERLVVPGPTGPAGPTGPWDHPQPLPERVPLITVGMWIVLALLAFLTVSAIADFT